MTSTQLTFKVLCPPKDLLAGAVREQIGNASAAIRDVVESPPRCCRQNDDASRQRNCHDRIDVLLRGEFDSRLVFASLLDINVPHADLLYAAVSTLSGTSVRKYLNKIFERSNALS